MTEVMVTDTIQVLDELGVWNIVHGAWVTRPGAADETEAAVDGLQVWLEDARGRRDARYPGGYPGGAGSGGAAAYRLIVTEADDPDGYWSGHRLGVATATLDDGEILDCCAAQ